MKTVQCKNIRLGAYKVEDNSLSCFGDQRYMLNDAIRTLVYWHKSKGFVIAKAS